MSRKAIWIIIVLMTIALIGITIIQFYRIKQTIDLNKENFNDRVTMALNEVKVLLEKEDKPLDPTTTDFFSSRQTLKVDILSDIPNRRSFELKETFKLLDGGDKIRDIKIENLKKYLKQTLKDQGIDLAYEYGVYSNESEAFTILNGHFVAEIGNSSQASTTPMENSLYDSEYQVSLFSSEIDTPGSLKIFFPKRSSWLWAKVWPVLLSTIVFLSLILFCFSYTIFIILRQKKISMMKTDFINNMTHEFKTPIATISLASDSITNDSIISNKEKVTRFAKIIKAENRRMLNQVEKVLQMAQIDKSDFNLNISEINMHELISKAVSNIRLQVQNRNGVIDHNLQAQHPIVKGDVTHLSNIVHNLLDNANKYSREAPKISVTTENTKEGFIIHVKDHGIGMSKEALKHIFDKFYRVHTGNIHDVKGFGLGLSYVKAIVDAHKGTVKVKSEEGKGSVFTVFLPFDKEK